MNLNKELEFLRKLKKNIGEWGRVGEGVRLGVRMDVFEEVIFL